MTDQTGPDSGSPATPGPSEAVLRECARALFDATGIRVLNNHNAPATAPKPADRATVLREEAALIRAHCPDHLDSNSAEGSWINCHCDVADDMERRAAEHTPADTGHDDNEGEQLPPVTEYRIETLDGDTWRALGLPYEIDIARRIRAEYLRGYPEAQVRILRCTRTAVVIEPADAQQDGAPGPWLVQKICCGHDDGKAQFTTWQEADRFREIYVDSSRIAGHERSAIVRAATQQQPKEA